MKPEEQFCPNLKCEARGKVGAGNIRIHSQKRRRYKCRECKKTFSERHGTALHGIRKPEWLIEVVIILLVYGCPVQAIVAAFKLDERTVRSWLLRAGEAGQKVHQHYVQQGQLEGQHIQVDEMRVKMVKGIQWLAMGILVGPQLWLGGVLSASRDKTLIRALAEQVRRCLVPAPVLVAFDGLKTYIKAFQRVFRVRVPSQGRGRPRLVAWPDVVLVQVIKRYVKGHVSEVEQRIVQGAPTLLARLLWESQGGIVINTAYIERLNATFRQHLTWLTRRTRTLAHRTDTLSTAMYLLGSVYNFCRFHDMLSFPNRLPRTPAMAAGLTDHRWSIHELLCFKVAPPPYVPPKRHGRKPKALLAVVSSTTTV
jgi:transposase-like protein